MYISRIQIKNFRNFKDLDIPLNHNAVFIGENKTGKTNLIHALRLVLDPTLPDSARQLREEDFWEGIESPMESGELITISVEIVDFEDDEKVLSIAQDYLINENPPTIRLTYTFAPYNNIIGNTQEQNTNYDYMIYGKDDLNVQFNSYQRKHIPLQVLPALRDAESDLNSWQKSPLRPLINRLKVSSPNLEEIASDLNEIMERLREENDIQTLSNSIHVRLEEMIGEFHSVEPTLGVAPTDSIRLLRSLRLYVDGQSQRNINEMSLGICNIIYLALLTLELEQKKLANERAGTFLAIEEPEAHLHPHLQRLVYRDFLKNQPSVILTTHSPHVASVSKLKSLVLLKNTNGNGSIATSTANLGLTKQEESDIERYLDATRGDILFAKGVILVEGDAEKYIIPAFASLLDVQLDEYGISICSVHGTDFVPYAKLLDEDGLKIPYVVITDGDPYYHEDSISGYRGINRGINILSQLNYEQGANEIASLKVQKQWGNCLSQLSEWDIFLNDSTLETALLECGYKDKMIETLRELGISEKSCQGFDGKYLSLIERVGKGRFAQRLSDKLCSNHIPEYIRSAILHIKSKTNESSE